MFLAIQRSVNTRNIDLSSFFPLTACQRRKKATKYNNKKLLCRECSTTGFVSFHTHTHVITPRLFSRMNTFITSARQLLTSESRKEGRRSVCVCVNSNVQLIYHRFGDFSGNKRFLIAADLIWKLLGERLEAPKLEKHSTLSYFSLVFIPKFSSSEHPFRKRSLLQILELEQRAVIRPRTTSKGPRSYCLQFQIALLTKKRRTQPVIRRERIFFFLSVTIKLSTLIQHDHLGKHESNDTLR